MSFSLKEIHAALRVTPERQKLFVANLLCSQRLEVAHEATQQRRQFLSSIQELAEDGQIAIVNSGMDCDCSMWRDHVSVVPSTREAVDAWVTNFYAGAEGPQSYYLERPSVAQQLHASSRDLALEAFEDGHPYSVTY